MVDDDGKQPRRRSFSRFGSLSDDLKTLDSSFTDFREQQINLNAKLRSAKRDLNQAFAAMDDCSKQHRSQLERYRELKQMYDEVKADAKQTEELAALDGLFVEMEKTRTLLDELRESKPSNISDKGAWLVRLMMGHVNVRVWKDSEKLHMKEEYNKFKFRTNFIFVMFPLLQMYFVSPLLFKLHQLWMIYYYLTLALRENILAINGSNIKPWWIYHHYVSVTSAIIMLLWPIKATLHQMKDAHFFSFLAVQGLIMMVHVSYQSNRVQVRRALGKANRMETSGGETIVEKPTRLKFMVPLLFVLYLFEAALGSFLISMAFERSDEYEFLWSTFITGILFLILCIGNLYTTLSVLLNKHKMRKRKRTVALMKQASSARLASSTSSGAAVKKDL